MELKSKMNKTDIEEIYEEYLTAFLKIAHDKDIPELKKQKIIEVVTTSELDFWVLIDQLEPYKAFILGQRIQWCNIMISNNIVKKMV